MSFEALSYIGGFYIRRKLMIPRFDITLSTADGKPFTVLCAIPVVAVMVGESNTVMQFLNIVS